MAPHIIALPARGSHPVLAKLEQGAIQSALHDIAALCEIATQARAQNNPALLTQFSALLMRLYDINLTVLPRQALKTEYLALCAGAGLYRYYETHFMAAAEHTAPAERLAVTDPATRAAVIDRALRDQRHIIPAVTAWLMRGNNGDMAPYYATGQNAAALLIHNDIGLKKEFEGVSIYRRVNDALRRHALEPLPPPFAPLPAARPRPG